ncbi:beta-ketoacyl synthase N-terminal-like domain-containing protein [Kitasatospora purpeofusca]|uniref:beta-ketoacyl synthase N-terminal-like domain-containing protein n=1 Tax=Kitasatospora purpeofusca TaxID=67352 RepID=UPI0035DD25B4
MTVLVTGVGVVLPRAASARELIEPGLADAPPVEPKDLVGRKGLRYKDRATQLAYCSARAALRDAALLDDEDGLKVAALGVAVVVSSNYGNIDTVTRAMDTITRETAAAGSPMDLPNASSNVVASSVAIRFGLRGPNLMLCNGATSGLDALRWGADLIRAGRVSRTLVLGVEPDNEAVRAFVGGTPTVDGSAAVVLESAEAAAGRGVPALAVLGAGVRGAGLATTLARLTASAGGPPALWQVPETDTLPEGLLDGVPREDLGARFGLASGALGVLQCAAAVGRFARGGDGPVFASSGSDADDASAGLVLLRPAA